MRFASLLACSLSLVLAGCPKPDDTSKQDSNTQDSPIDTSQGTDADGDGVAAEDGDCNDGDASIHPGAEEACDGVDNNCNEAVDEGFSDVDSNGTPDCRDVEACDGLDNDADGQIDEDFGDADGDGVKDCLDGEACDGVDNNGDGDIDEGYDADGDGYTQCGSDTEDADCDDSDANIHPGANDRPDDSIDNDCDGLTDESAYTEGDLSITEIMSNPAYVGDPLGEWFEVHNDSDHTVVLNGLTIQSGAGESHQIESTDLLEVLPGDYFVLGINDKETTNGHAPVGYQYSDIMLGNESDELSLWADSQLIDEVTWDDGATMPDASGASMMIDEGTYGAVENDDPARWCASIYGWSDVSGDDGSPMATNGLCATWDHDGDGWIGNDGDCDDSDPEVYPGAPELDYDKDYNCDGRANLTPTAVAFNTDPAETCSPLQLVGALSSDPEGATLTYSWELVSAPAGSVRTTADITTTTTANPTIPPDVGGDYTFLLTVSDGYSTDTETLVVNVAERPGNATPVANAGADQSYAATSDCTPISYGVSYECPVCSDIYFFLDGSGSSDANGDELEYSWAVTSGSTYGTLSTTGPTTAQVLFSDAPGTYGVATNTDVVVTLTVSDCMSATSSDDVTLTYTCTGS